MIPAIKLQLDVQERQTLEALSERHFRRPADMLRFLLWKEARQEGLTGEMLSANDKSATTLTGEGALVTNP